MKNISTIVKHTWLAQQIAKGTKQFTLLDATSPLPGSPQNPLKDYKEKHIPGAIFFDIGASCDKSAPYAHTLGTPDAFAEHVGSLGITKDTHVVLYDNLAGLGVFSAPRAWWMFRLHGHKDVSILEGGLKTWIDEEHEVTTVIPEVEAVKYNASFDPKLLATYDEVLANLQDEAFQVMDARGKGRYEGSSPEPRPGVEPGHIPKSINISFRNIFQKDSREFKSGEDLKKTFEEFGMDLSKPITSTCGSGISACCLALGAYLAGKEDVRVFSGSWEEFYTQNKDTAPENIISVADVKE